MCLFFEQTEPSVLINCVLTKKNKCTVNTDWSIPPYACSDQQPPTEVDRDTQGESGHRVKMLIRPVETFFSRCTDPPRASRSTLVDGNFRNQISPVLLCRLSEADGQLIQIKKSLKHGPTYRHK